MKKDTTILISVACLYKESKGKKYWLLVKSSDDSPWELPKATVRKGESSVRAILRVMGELAGMSVKVLEEVGRGSATISVNNRPVPQKFLYYLLVFKASAGETLGFDQVNWLEYAKVVREVASKKEASQLREARKVVAKWEKEHLKSH
jgi:ADP-ribose pyrophosphatase YjhB (NUDIX family)